MRLGLAAGQPCRQPVRDVVDLLHRKAANDRGLQLVLRLDLARSEDLVLCDRSMLGDVLSRLLDNAVKFTKTGSIRVDVELLRRKLASYPAAEVQITVTDTGIGIPLECLELVFTPFFQVDSGSTRAVGGTGLGLAIANAGAATDGRIDLRRESTGARDERSVSLSSCDSAKPRVPASRASRQAASRPIMTEGSCCRGQCCWSKTTGVRRCARSRVLEPDGSERHACTQRPAFAD